MYIERQRLSISKSVSWEGGGGGVIDGSLWNLEVGNKRVFISVGFESWELKA
jgi:hypothetical protein